MTTLAILAGLAVVGILMGISYCVGAAHEAARLRAEREEEEDSL